MDLDNNMEIRVKNPFNARDDDFKGAKTPPEMEPGSFFGSYWFDYLTEDGRMYFGFAFFPQLLENGEKYYEIDIIYQPKYDLVGPRDLDLNTIHQLDSPRGGYLICVEEGYEPKTIEQAMGVAKVWAEKTWQYILNGETFQNA